MKFSEIFLDPVIYKIIKNHYESVDELHKILNENVITEELRGYDKEILNFLDRYINTPVSGDVYTPILVVFNIGQNIIEVQYLEDATFKNISSFDNSYIFDKDGEVKKFPKDLSSGWIISRTIILNSVLDFKQFSSVLKLTFPDTKFIYKEYN
jgi:hypothetical protein